MLDHRAGRVVTAQLSLLEVVASQVKCETELECVVTEQWIIWTVWPFRNSCGWDVRGGGGRDARLEVSPAASTGLTGGVATLTCLT